MKEPLIKSNRSWFFLIFRNWLIKNLVILLFLPLTVISTIFVIYGEVIDKLLTLNPELFKLFQLMTQLHVLSSELNIPAHIRSLGCDSIIFLILIYFVWLFTHSFYCYIQLTYQYGLKGLLFLETVLLLLIFIFIVSPSLPLMIAVLGYSIIAAQIILIGLYWRYSLSSKNE